MVDSPRIDSDIIALVQHVELNESGWIDVAVTKAVRFLFWLMSTPATEADIFDQRTKVGLSELSRERIRNAIESLVEIGSLISVGNNLFKLAEQEITAIDSSVQDAGEIESKVREKVLAAAHEAAPDLPTGGDGTLWERFHGEFIAPFIKEFGARAYELITGAKTEVHQTAFISEFLGRFPDDQKAVLEAMILALLDKNNSSCRTYTLRMLNSYFFHSAITLPPDVIEKVFYNKNGRVKRLKLVLDTNFIFSLLQLHSNPSNEAVSLLLQTIARLPREIAIGMYVLPQTIQEFRRALVHYETLAKSFRVTKNVVDVGIKSNISGVLETYFKRVRDGGYCISSKEYFDPYHNDTVSLLNQHKVHVLEGDEEKYASNQATIDDAIEQQAFYKSKFINEPRRQKTYEQIWHDMVLWHYISDRRPSVSDTVFEAQWVGVTIDYGLMAFDSHKRKGRGIPSMVHPAALVQALQMLIPADENLERTILALMQMPFLFEAFNLEDEKVTQRILSSISRFEDIDDLSPEAIVEVLGNKALRTQMERPQGKDEELALVRDAIIEHAAELGRRALEADRNLELSAIAAKEAQAAYASRVADLEAQRFASEQGKKKAEEAAVSAAEERDRAAKEVQNLQAVNAEQEGARLRLGQSVLLGVQTLTCLAVLSSQC
ncbi:MAG: hypothetical protein EOS07_17815 [Mesorhizobium sp.]|nr:MAG: hypothetical protein EOS07_17815 [Mesorhizobium sp.]